MLLDALDQPFNGGVGADRPSAPPLAVRTRQTGVQAFLISVPHEPFEQVQVAQFPSASIAARCVVLLELYPPTTIMRSSGCSCRGASRRP